MEKESFFQLKQKELAHLVKKKKENPELFEQKPFFDTQDVLQSVGISGVFPENLPLGYLKFLPQDFVVEEVPKSEELQTVALGPFLKSSSRLSNNNPTIFATLVKCGLSTLEAREELAKTLHLEEKTIGFAGMKDKNAISSQRISFRGVNINNLQKIYHSNFFLKNAYSGKGIVEIGSLKGNLFTILVRTDKSFSREIFLKQLEKIRKDGFYNFFYLQRFGTPRLISHLLGLFILKGEYEKAVYNFFTYPRDRELPYFQKLRGEFERNWKNWLEIEEIIKPFPIIFRHEKKLLNHLKKNPQDFLGALQEIPDQIQLWVFAYASYLFNRKLSALIQENKELPDTLPLILSKEQSDWQPYSEFLKADKIFLPLRPLRPFSSFLQYRRRQIKTRESAEFKQIKILSEGILFSFFLPKAAYATTLLSHFFTLASGFPIPEGISLDQIDPKVSLRTGNLTNILTRFREVIQSKGQDFFKKFE